MIGLFAVALMLDRRWRVGAIWLGTSGSALAIVGILKSLTYACGWHWRDLLTGWYELESPSGHAAAVALLCGMGTAVLFGRQQNRLKAALVAALLGSSVVGEALLVLKIHSPLEIAVGAAIGVAATACFTVLSGSGLQQRFALRPLLIIGVVMTALHGMRLPAEEIIRVDAAGLVQRSLPFCSQAAAKLVDS